MGAGPAGEFPKVCHPEVKLLKPSMLTAGYDIVPLPSSEAVGAVELRCLLWLLAVTSGSGDIVRCGAVVVPAAARRSRARVQVAVLRVLAKLWQ
jgi:hypothetical protein